ncbi:hypothetical protein PMAYCL1PPCAC_29438, partial [Pristionchus mayeri]
FCHFSSPLFTHSNLMISEISISSHFTSIPSFIIHLLLLDLCETVLSFRMDLNGLPFELIQEIDSFLPFEDSLNLQSALPRCLSLLSFYDSIQVCDDPNECFIIDSKGRKERRPFLERNFSLVARSLVNLKEVTLMVKEANPYALPSTSLSSFTPFKETSLYCGGGLMGRLVSELEDSFPLLSSITIHIDVSFDSIKGHLLYCPTEDLYFALRSLTWSNCKVLIQISFGSMEFSESDALARNFLMRGMKETMEKIELSHPHANVEFVIDPFQGYTDMTIELPNLEYSFAFFYYNPSICDAVDKKEEMMESEGECDDSSSTYPLHLLPPPIHS